LKHQDKNNDICLNCPKRLQYIKEIEQTLGFTASYPCDAFPLQSLPNIRQFQSL
jgi:hypothetical protein